MVIPTRFHYKVTAAHLEVIGYELPNLNKNSICQEKMFLSRTVTNLWTVGTHQQNCFHAIHQILFLTHLLENVLAIGILRWSKDVNPINHIKQSRTKLCKKPILTYLNVKILATWGTYVFQIGNVSVENFTLGPRGSLSRVQPSEILSKILLAFSSLGSRRVRYTAKLAAGIPNFSLLKLNRQMLSPQANCALVSLRG